MTDAPIAIGINGFGRVGRALLKAALLNNRVRITAINDPFVTPEYVAYLIKHDSSGNPTAGNVEYRKDSVVVDGSVIAVHQKADPSSVPWGDSRVVYVVECSGVYTTSDRAGAHLAGGAARVVITAPSTDAATIVAGANMESFKGSMQVISAGSCTGMVLAPLLRFVNETYGLEQCSFTCVHSITPSQKVIDGTNYKEWRAARGALNNIIPHTTGAMKTIAKALPSIGARVVGSALRVPVATGCALDVTLSLTNGVSKEGFDAALRAAADSARYSSTLSFSSEELVSSDVHHTGALVYDSKASSTLSPTTHKLLFWFDNEYGYALRLLDLIIQTNATW
jgi:glyceraldehyde 3-phosphate dehydrogenase